MKSSNDGSESTCQKGARKRASCGELMEWAIWNERGDVQSKQGLGDVEDCSSQERSQGRLEDSQCEASGKGRRATEKSDKAVPRLGGSLVE